MNTLSRHTDAFVAEAVITILEHTYALTEIDGASPFDLALKAYGASSAQSDIVAAVKNRFSLWHNWFNPSQKKMELMIQECVDECRLGE